MKLIPLTLLCAALLACLLLANKFPSKQIPRIVLIYLGVLGACHVVTLLGYLRIGTFDSDAYRFFYYCCTVVSTGCAVLVARHFNNSHILLKKLAAGALPSNIAIIYGEALILGSIGTAILLSLYGERSSAGWALRVALGLYLLSRSALALIFSAGFVRNRALFLRLNDWLPAVTSLIVFVALALFLVRAQRELSEQEATLGQVEQLVEVQQ